MSSVSLYLFCGLIVFLGILVCIIGFKIMDYNEKRKYISECKKRPDGRWNEKLKQFEEGFYRKSEEWIPSFYMTSDSPFKRQKDGSLVYMPKIEEEKEQQQKVYSKNMDDLNDMLRKAENT